MQSIVEKIIKIAQIKVKAKSELILSLEFKSELIEERSVEGKKLHTLPVAPPPNKDQPRDIQDDPRTI